MIASFFSMQRFINRYILMVSNIRLHSSAFSHHS
nr:MAG TPA: hypothetical protein [Caudoviricetes sp.]DAY94655.1 MAG TPA: hypothetical protein [Caudoviricetes sp.]